MQSIDLIIEARWALPMDGGAVLEHAALAIDGGRILAIGPAPLLATRYSPRERLERREHAIAPGLVNAHTHAAMSLMRSVAVRGPLMQWLNETIWPLERRCVNAQFVRSGTQLAMAEMLAAGITCFADMYYFPEEVARLARVQRLRVVIGAPIVDGRTPWAADLDEHLDKAARLWDEYRDDPLVQPSFAPHSPYAVRRSTFARLRRLIDQLDAPLAMHLHETQTEVQDSLTAHGERPLSWLADEGLLRPGFSAVHMNWLTDEDIDLAARTGISVVHCPQSNQRLGSGICPVSRLRAAGVNVALGTDGAASVGALDLLAEARAACLLASLSTHNPQALGAPDSLRMATLGGAQALGLGHEIGSLTAGKAADVICIDLSAPACQPVDDPADAIVYSAGRSAVTDVWVAGRAMVRDGRLLTFDPAELAAITRDFPARLAPGAAA
ncbi:MAG TPA: TRZ/ATZ family hydrolase [Steroidobacteraceae bacterium]|nr:TRZ/ATZ family hydrolase [Steroidobacteraceae bacterium]HQW10347.1 TRZ/ATZ family hydrolase [Steroidobacteraceae bacterium]HQX47580.1 TRZ/ATZ family hydrolase [Steroidobacteraceae bacterium]HQX77347.1 TRZ/ATZ family hydrolase [Steroidobacteraceae bacterium]HQZ79774.1 TRZ/ATZ family hydrolase [Steroidobacteraceae bacterium]